MSPYSGSTGWFSTMPRPLSFTISVSTSTPPGIAFSASSRHSTVAAFSPSSHSSVNADDSGRRSSAKIYTRPRT